MQNTRTMVFTNGTKYTLFTVEKSDTEEYCYAIFNENEKRYIYTREIPHYVRWLAKQWAIKLRLYPKGTMEKLGV